MKKNKIIIIGVVVLIAILFLVLFLRKNDTNSEIVKIEYSYGGGYGTIVDASTKRITITSDGKVELSNEYNSYTESFQIDQSKYNELSNYILARKSLFNKKVKEQKDIMDGGSSHIKIEYDDGTTKEVGGYMVSNKKYLEIRDKIYEIIGSEKIYQYVNNIQNHDE